MRDPGSGGRARPGRQLFLFSTTAAALPTPQWSRSDDDCNHPSRAKPGRCSATRALSMSTIAFTVCFAVWTIFSIIGVRDQRPSSGLTETAVRPADRHADPDRLAGAHRARHLDRPLSAAGSSTPRRCWRRRSRPSCSPSRTTYTQMLIAALGVGLAGGSFAVGVAYVSRFYPGRQAGHGARHLRRRQCRRGGDQIPRAVRAARLGLAGRRADLGGRCSSSWRSSSGSRTERRSGHPPSAAPARRQPQQLLAANSRR